jgi:hypothetical protein
MQRLGLVGGITDRQDLLNPYRDAEGLNVHKCYAYFVNAATGEAIAHWWREMGWRELAVSASPSLTPSG